ncbi:HAMP domain-containing sensor histidine kinase [Salinibaculum salinum]|uniref:sensor histidine kinase n=1 Tax=Salinibaculum salinum TaxID=3131996 RepID=UPI0030ED312F
MAEEGPASVDGGWWRYLVSAIGGLLLVVGVGSVLLDAQLSSEELLQISALVVLCLLLIAVGVRIALDLTDSEDAIRILAWVSGGVLALATLGAWFQFVVPTTDTTFQTLLVFLSALAAGALFGAVVGYYDVRVRSLVERASREQGRREFLNEQQEALSALNGILRHQILNDASAISGRAELLDAEKIDRDTAVDSIVDHCEHMTDTVDRIETVVDVLTWVTDTGETSVDLAIDRAIATIEDDRPDAPIEVTGETDTSVLADALLYLALYETLDNALRHGEPPVTVSVEERTDSVVVTVADTGTTVGVSPRKSLFEPNTRGTDSEGDGLGLYLADLILDRYGGEIRLAGGSQTAFEIELPQR